MSILKKTAAKPKAKAAGKPRKKAASADKYSAQKDYAGRMRDKGFERYSTWIPEGTTEVVAKFTADLRDKHLNDKVKKK